MGKMLHEIDQSINLVSASIGSNILSFQFWITLSWKISVSFVPVFTFFIELNLNLSKNETKMQIEIIEQRILNETGLY